MVKMVNKMSFLLMIVISSIVISCGKTNNPLSEMVGTDSALFVQIDNPAKFLSNLDAFIKPLGIDSITQGKELSELATSLKDITDGMLDVAWIDLSKPLGCLLRFGEQSASGLYYQLMIPVTKAFNIQTAKQGFTKKNITPILYKNYVVLIPAGYTTPSFPVEKPLDLNALSRFANNGLAILVHMDALKSQLNIDVEQIKRSLYETLEKDITSSQEMVFSEKIANVMVDIIDQLQMVGISIHGDDKGFLMQSYCTFSEKGWIDALLHAIKPGKDLRTALKYTAQDGLFNLVYDFDPQQNRAFTLAMFNWYAKLFPDKLDHIESYKQFVDRSMNWVGSRGAFSFRFDYDAEHLKNLNLSDHTEHAMNEFIAELAQGISFQLVGVMEMKDGLAYEKELAKAFEAGIIQNFYEAYFNQENDSPYKISLNYTPHSQDTSSPYNTVTIGLEVPGERFITMRSDEIEQTRLMSEIISQLCVFNYRATKNNFYFSFGNTNRDILSNLVNQSTMGVATLSDSKSVQEMVIRFPKGSQILWNCNIGRILRLMKQSGEAGVDSIPDLGDDAPGICTYLYFGQGRVETGSFLSLSEIAPLVQYLLSQTSASFNVKSSED
ncbi:hypothetical protein [Gracilinema caldarium]|uniref:Uncharacterized protein n=1 Tax=Gracilinema caldarium (strain ATCC 51460 / DSM 7334 / H1) TaxID=744872 RepID=F8EXD1_GRAC1|nr:hypothetical protein [Gracilinema caldarium]AEJ19158.1 hypothetical protein Spica_1008 [Gracilinema caldarium DSM 7334]